MEAVATSAIRSKWGPTAFGKARRPSWAAFQPVQTHAKRASRIDFMLARFGAWPSATPELLPMGDPRARSLAACPFLLLSRPLSSTRPSRGRDCVMVSILLEEKVRIPAGIDDVEAFRRWARSDAFPEHGRFAFLQGTLWVDLS